MVALKGGKHVLALAPEVLQALEKY